MSYCTPFAETFEEFQKQAIRIKLSSFAQIEYFEGWEDEVKYLHMYGWNIGADGLFEGCYIVEGHDGVFTLPISNDSIESSDLSKLENTLFTEWYITECSP